jgi:hypothetical protein
VKPYAEDLLVDHVPFPAASNPARSIGTGPGPAPRMAHFRAGSLPATTRLVRYRPLGVGSSRPMKLRQRAVDALKAITPVTARRRLVRLRLGVRRLSARYRALPDFLVLGGQRCGTSSLYKYLGRHPEIAPSLRKEVEYFTIDYGRGEGWYRAHFPLRIRRRLHRALGRSMLTFEATPDYLFDPRAPQRIKELLPDARLIVLLREPVERAFSHYHHMARLGLEDLSFSDAVAAEEQRLAGQLDEMALDPLSRVLPFRRFSYAARGFYAEQLARWFELFPREQFLILDSADFFADPRSTLLRILEFVGAAPWTPAEFRNYSYTSKPAENPDIPEPTAAELRRRFSTPNRQLEQLLGTDLPWGEGHKPA